MSRIILILRYRKLSEAKGPQGPAVGHALRAAINTPIQVLQYFAINCNYISILPG